MALSGHYNTEQLAQLFMNNWIGFTDCGAKCPRHEHCHFTKQDPYRPGKLQDIRCGPALETLQNFVQCTFTSACALSRTQRQGYIDAAYHLTQYVIEAEWYLGGMMNKEFIGWLGTTEYRIGFFSLTVRLREHLDRFAGELSKAGLFCIKRTLILVEGQSEKLFLEKLRVVRFTWFKDLHVDTYEGLPNRKYAKLRLFTQRLRKQGYELFIQGDCDARTQSRFDDLICKNIVSKDHTFQFHFDFESAFPPWIQLAALQSVGLLSDVSMATFSARMATPSRKSLGDSLKEEFSIDLSKYKTALASALADVLIRKEEVFLDRKFWQTEIGSFLDAIRRFGW